MGINIELPVSGGGGVSIGDAIGGASTNQLLTTDGSGNLSERPNILTSSGGGSNFLADDGTYKAVSTGVAIGDSIVAIVISFDIFSFASSPVALKI